MRKIIFFISFTLLSIAVFSSCTKDVQEFTNPFADIQGEERSHLFDKEVLKELIVTKLKADEAERFENSDLPNLIQANKITVIKNHKCKNFYK